MVWVELIEETPPVWPPPGDDQAGILSVHDGRASDHPRAPAGIRDDLQQVDAPLARVRTLEGQPAAVGRPGKGAHSTVRCHIAGHAGTGRHNPQAVGTPRIPLRENGQCVGTGRPGKRSHRRGQTLHLAGGAAIGAHDPQSAGAVGRGAGEVSQPLPIRRPRQAGDTGGRRQGPQCALLAVEHVGPAIPQEGEMPLAPEGSHVHQRRAGTVGGRRGGCLPLPHHAEEDRCHREETRPYASYRHVPPLFHLPTRLRRVTAPSPGSSGRRA